MRIIHHKENCIGCKACQQACQDLHNLSPKTKIMEIIEKESGKADTLAVEYQMSVCRQCIRPACMAECMEGAISRNAEGVVMIDEFLCIGCGRCMEGCPEYVIRLRRTNHGKKATKCDVCISYNKKSDENEAAPACVRACPLNCISVG